MDEDEGQRNTHITANEGLDKWQRIDGAEVMIELIPKTTLWWRVHDIILMQIRAPKFNKFNIHRSRGFRSWLVTWGRRKVRGVIEKLEWHSITNAFTVCPLVAYRNTPSTSPNRGIKLKRGPLELPILEWNGMTRTFLNGKLRGFPCLILSFCLSKRFLIFLRPACCYKVMPALFRIRSGMTFIVQALDPPVVVGGGVLSLLLHGGPVLV